MSKLDATVRSWSPETAFGALTSRRRRQLFVLVNEYDGVGRSQLTVDELARHLATVSECGDRSSCRINLVHQELPMLEEAGVIDWDRSAGTVSVPAHLSFDTSFIERTLESDKLDWDAVFEALSNERRRTVLTVLKETTEALSLETLAKRVAAHELGAAEHTVATTLHHQHLPVLREAGLVSEQADGFQYTGEILERSGIDTNFQVPTTPIMAHAQD
ncbi:hypothetical protein ACLI4Y_11645 [Natrialbaceae archaeon A-CW3]